MIWSIQEGSIAKDSLKRQGPLEGMGVIQTNYFIQYREKMVLDGATGIYPTQNHYFSAKSAQFEHSTRLIVKNTMLIIVSLPFQSA